MSSTRRQFLVGVGVAAGAGVGAVVREGSSATAGPTLLRPPGAGPERDFIAACIRCGQCVEKCPYDTLRLASATNGVTTAGTPYLNARDVPCYLCQGYDDLECISACPTAALQPVDDLLDIRMGTAVIDEGICLAYNGTICRSCWHACPFPNQAIVFDPLLRPVIDEDVCIGCGLCDHACPAEPSAVPIQPGSVRTGSLGVAQRTGGGL